MVVEKRDRKQKKVKRNKREECGDMDLVLTVGRDCLLKHIPLVLEKKLKEALTIDNPEYLAAKKYGRWIGKRLKPQLKYYEPVVQGLRFPRGFANRAVLLCRQECGQDPQIIDQRRRLAEVDFHFLGKLRDYQQEALAAAEKRSFGVLEAGTGSGKTVMALALIAQRRQPTIIVVHTKELLHKWRDRVLEFLDVEAGQVGDGKYTTREVTVAIVNSARKRVEELVPLFGHLVVDECHRVPATLFTEVVSRFNCHYQLGLSATAFRSARETTKLIYYFMGDRIHRVDQEELKATGAILAPEIIRRTTDFTYRYTGKYHALIKKLVTHEGRNRQILDDILDILAKGEQGSVLVVSDRVSHCRFFQEKLMAHGIHCELLHGQVPAEERAAIVEAVQRGDVDVLVATLQLISEGFDCPGLSTLFLTTPISFEGRLLQVIGRIMRPADNKRARVYDYVDEKIPTLNRSAEARSLVLSKL